MKTRIYVLLFLFINCISYSQNDSIPTNKNPIHNNGYKDLFEKALFKVGGGVLIPQKGLKDYFGISPLIEISYTFPLKRRKSVELAAQFVIPNQKEDFKYIRTIDTINAKATIMLNVLLKLKKDVIKSEKSELNIGLGIGISGITTDARNPFYEGKEDDKKYEMIKSILISPGIEYAHKFSNGEHLSIGFNLQYSPYKIEGALREDIGSIFYIPKISYKF
jgi:hypothetical protein